MKLVSLSLSLAALLTACATVPLQAQSFPPTLAGAYFCTLRARGVDYDIALRASISRFWDVSRSRIPAYTTDPDTTTDTVDFVNFVIRTCPSYFSK